MPHIFFALFLCSGLFGTLQAQQKVPYEDLRMQAFNTNPESLGVDVSDSKTKVYGVVMDWDLGESFATVVAFKTGDASLYVEDGPTYIGGVTIEAVNKAAKNLVAEAHSYLAKADKTDEVSSSPNKKVTFYLLTNKGVFAYSEKVKSIEKGKSEWTALFQSANRIITEYRNIGN